MRTQKKIHLSLKNFKKCKFILAFNYNFWYNINALAKKSVK